MTAPTPLTLVFSPSFGAVHWDSEAKGFTKNPKGGVIIRDENLAGRVVIFRPVLPNAQLRTTFELGRHPNCWLKIGWMKDHYTKKMKEVTDEKGYPLMNYYPRITLTFQWMDAEQWAWVGKSAWFIIPGGVFINKDGVRERSGSNIDVYLNNTLINSSGNPEPLFPNGIDQMSIAIINRDVHNKFRVPYAGKIIALDKTVDKHTTGWPAAMWDGPSWPLLGPPIEARPDPKALAQQADVEEEITKSKAPLPPNHPWYALDMKMVWSWYTGKSTLTQMIFMVLGSASVALILWAWSR